MDVALVAKRARGSKGKAIALPAIERAAIKTATTRSGDGMADAVIVGPRDGSAFFNFDSSGRKRKVLNSHRTRHHSIWRGALLARHAHTFYFAGWLVAVPDKQPSNYSNYRYDYNAADYFLVHPLSPLLKLKDIVALLAVLATVIFEVFTDAQCSCGAFTGSGSNLHSGTRTDVACSKYAWHRSFELVVSLNKTNFV